MADLYKDTSRNAAIVMQGPFMAVAASCILELHLQKVMHSCNIYHSVMELWAI